MLTDLQTTLRRLRNGKTHPAFEVARAIDAASSAPWQHAFLKTTFDEALAVAGSSQNLSTRLAGLPISVKDLFDVAGQTTSAGSVALKDAAPAQFDCPAVARLRRAGAALMGRTNMVEFAFSGVGVNPHFGTPANAHSKDLALIPGVLPQARPFP